MVCSEVVLGGRPPGFEFKRTQVACNYSRIEHD